MITFKSLTTTALSAVVFALGSVTSVHAQSRDTMFDPLTLRPAPSRTRLANGAPGPKYWQNRADYSIRATLDTATRKIIAEMTFRYTNNSPNTLDILWMQTEQDPNMPITQFAQKVNGKLVPTTLENQNTETKVTLAAPIKPGTTAEFQVAWSFSVDRNRRGRMGRVGTEYQVAQWFPRVNVYDDVKGWNTEPYTTGAEFFEEYGDYSMEVTLPAGYIVAATGTLDNPTDVLTETERARLALAAKSDTVIHIVTAAELQSGAARPTTTGTLTWKFHANNVRDMVWCGSPNFQWDASSWKGIVAQSYYTDTDPTNAWTQAADMARMSIQQYSERWFPYPYPQVSVVEGRVFGMEYPMLSMDANMGSDVQQLYDIITHEVGHNWFPMIVGSNERVHTWQDEGFNQFINTFSAAARYPQGGDQTARGQRYVRKVGQMMVGNNDSPLETGQVIGNASSQYFKTAGVLQMLRNKVMGPDKFDKGLRTYTQRWAFKHPTPVDFFRTMNDAAGADLSWYWREWFLNAPKFDQAIDSVQGSGSRLTVIYRNKQPGVMPLLVQFTFSDSSKQSFTYPADIWKKGNTYTVPYTFSGKTVSQIAIDPERNFVDEDRANNTWVPKK